MADRSVSTTGCDDTAPTVYSKAIMTADSALADLSGKRVHSVRAVHG